MREATLLLQPDDAVLVEAEVGRILAEEQLVCGVQVPLSGRGALRVERRARLVGLADRVEEGVVQGCVTRKPLPGVGLE